MPKVKEELAPYLVKQKRAKKKNTLTIPPRKRVTMMLDGMKDSATYKDILYRVYVLHNLEQGEKDFRDGRVFSNEDVEQMIDKWLK
jgi:hypothetical protein